MHTNCDEIDEYRKVVRFFILVCHYIKYLLDVPYFTAWGNALFDSDLEPLYLKR